MNSSRMLAGLGALLAVCAVGSTLWVGNAVRSLRGEMAAVRADVATVRSESKTQLSDLIGRASISASSVAPVALEEGTLVDPFTGVDIKQVSDIQARVDAMVGRWIPQRPSEIAQAEELASLLVEIDGWLFAPEEQAKAGSIIAKEVDVLRRLIKSQVKELSGAAIDATNGKQAAAAMAQINRLLSMYPSPTTTAEQAELEQITTGILSTSRRVEEIRFLRYNQWAIAQIEDALKRYRSELAIGSVQDVTKLVKRDREKLRTAAISTMSKIDTASLNPAVMDLYSYAYTLFRDAMGSDDDSRAKLAKGFADPTTQRRTPLDF